MRAAETKVARNSAWNLLGWISLTALSFVSAPLFLKGLGSSHYGLLALLTTLVTPFGLLEMGMSEATVKYVSESLGRDDFKQAEKYLNTTLCFNLVVGFVGGVAILLLVGVMANDVFNVSAADHQLAIQCMGWVALNWACTRVRQTFLGAMSALRNYKVISALNLAYQSTFVLSGLAVLFFGGGLLDLVMAQALISLAGILIWYWVLRLLSPQMVIRPVIDWAAFRETGRFGAWQLCNNIGDLFTQQAQRWQIGAALPVSSVGYYNLSYQVGGLVYSLSSRVGQVFFPEISRLHGRGAEAEAATLLVRVNWLLSCVQIPCFVVIFTLAHSLLFLWAGAEVASASGAVLRILCLGLAVASLFAVPSYYLLGIGRPRWLAIMAGIQGTITLSCAALLIPRMGIVGAAWALTAGTITHLAILLLLWWRFLRSAITVAEYLASTFGSLVCGALFAAVLPWIYAGFQPAVTWGATLAAALVLGCLSIAVCLSVSRILPGGHSRWQWLRTSLGKAVNSRRV